jgi:hypothetical protein
VGERQLVTQEVKKIMRAGQSSIFHPRSQADLGNEQKQQRKQNV